jgi:dTDP-4-dehydrorhamnose reductase
MKVLIIGKGQLGKELYTALDREGVDVDITSKDKKDRQAITLDVIEIKEIAKVIKKDYDVVVNCAAYTNVDGCETNPGLSKLINYKAVKTMAKQCKDKDIHFIQISTDFVFPGGEDDLYYYHSQKLKPVNIYGAHKLYAESPALVIGDCTVIRPSWVYSHHEGNFLYKVVDNLLNNKPMAMATDMVGCPTSATTLAQYITDLITNCYGMVKRSSQVLHINDNMAVSKYEFTKEIANAVKAYSGIEMAYDIKEAKTSDFKMDALRPMVTRMAFSGPRKIVEKLNPTCKFQSGVLNSVAKILDRIRNER